MFVCFEICVYKKFKYNIVIFYIHKHIYKLNHFRWNSDYINSSTNSSSLLVLFFCKTIVGFIILVGESVDYFIIFNFYKSSLLIDNLS